MKRSLVLLLMAFPAYATGPKYVGQSTPVDIKQEFDNVYHDISNPTINYAVISTATITNLTVSALSGVAVGKVKQVVQGTFTSSFGTTSTSYQATGLKVTITPSATTSKVWCVSTFQCKTSNVVGDFCFATMERAGTDLSGGTGGFAHFISNSTGAFSYNVPYSIAVLDSPSTTSSTTYEVYIRTSAGSATATLNGNSGQGDIVCAEIGA